MTTTTSAPAAGRESQGFGSDGRAAPSVLPMSDNPYKDFRYFYREGMDLRPAPKRRTSAPSWSTLRHNIFDRWHDVKDTWAGYDTFQTRLLDDHMWQCDEVGNAVAEMFKRIGPEKARADFETALNEGIDKVESPEPELVEFFRQVDNLPDWLDLEAAERGRISYYNVTKTAETLAIGFAYWATTMEDRTSAATGETAMFAVKAMQRSIETAKFFVDLGREDVFDRYSDGLKAAVHVRLLHAQANRGLERIWGPDHYNEFGRPIGSSFLVSGEGWFALMPLAIDEFFGRPHSGQEWDDVAMYWSYVLYMMGSEERLIPKTGDEMRRMTDYIYANGGRSSAYHQEVATALMTILHRLHPAVPVVVLGALSQIVGYEDTKFMVQGTKWENAHFRAIGALWALASRIECTATRILDKLPGAERRKQKRAHNGKPPWDTVTKLLEAHIRATEPGTEAKWTLHDDSKEARS